MPLRPLLKNKLLLQKHFNVQEISIDDWPYWMFEENMIIVNEIIEEENKQRKEQEDSQSHSIPDTGSIMRNISSNIPKY